MELISVVIPVYNVEQYFIDCLESVLQQTYKNIEIILVDDGSSDRTGYICDCYAYKDSRVHVIHKKNNGVSSARNVGIKASNGEFLTFVDGDDTAYPEMIEVLRDKMVDKKADMVCSSLRFLYPDGSVNNRNYSYETKMMSSEEVAHDFFTDEKVKEDLYGPYNKLYKLDRLRSCVFNEKLQVGEDMLFSFETLTRINSVVMIDRPLYNYKKRENSLSTRSFNSGDLDYVKASEQIYVLCNNNFPKSLSNALIWYYSIVVNHIFLLSEYPKIKKECMHEYLEYVKFVKEHKYAFKSIDKMIKKQFCLSFLFPFLCPLIMMVKKYGR